MSSEREVSLVHGIGEAHKRHTRGKNFREEVRGRLFQGRSFSRVLDERHLLAAVRYTELNPVAAGIAAGPGGYGWSSARSPSRARSLSTSSATRRLYATNSSFVT